VSPEQPDHVVMILNVDPFLEPSNGPNYFPFDPNVLYEMKVDNNHDGKEDITFQFRFKTEIRLPGVFTGFVGGIAGIPPITALDGNGSQGLSLRQTYTVTMVTKHGTQQIGEGQTLFAVPSNVGPRTMPNYNALRAQGIYSLPNGVSVFAGTVADPFFIDLGAAFDSLNFRAGSSFIGTGGVLTTNQDQNDGQNFAADSLSGFNVNTIALQVPISMVIKSATSPVIGTWAATYRSAQTVRLAPNPVTTSGSLQQVNRMGNPLINELVIGLGSKDTFSMSQPSGDSQFAGFALDPLLAHAINAVFGITVPDPPRKDLLPLLTYSGPTVPTGTPAGPVSDMLRLNTAIGPTAMASRKRLGVLGGDTAGFPNGRRLTDDVVDITLRAVAGALCNTPVNTAPAGGTATLSVCTAQGNTFVGTQVLLLGDGVNTNDVPTQETFPYVAFAQNGYSRVHRNVGDKSCAQGSGCPAQ